MKKIILYSVLALCLIFIISKETQAQWQPDVRLTNDSAPSQTSQNNAWCIASSGNTIHVVWWDNRDAVSEIYYKRSTDGGISWGADTRLTNYYATAYYPSVSVSGQIVHVAWTDVRDANQEIYYKRSTDGGVSWGADTRLTNAPNDSRLPSVSVSGQVVHVVWHDKRDANLEIYYKRSTNGGTSWGADTRLTNNSAVSQYPSVTVSDSTMHVVWEDYRDGNLEIYYKRSTNGGISWGADTRLTNAPSNSKYPSISVSDSLLHVVWQDHRDANYEIYYKRSTDRGTSWETDTRLTNNPDASYNPSVTVSDSTVHVVWHDHRDYATEIYYKRNPNGNLVGINNISSEFPLSFSLKQN